MIYAAVSKRGLSLWRIRLLLLAFLPSVLVSLFFDVFTYWWNFCTIAWVVVFVLFYFVYFPVRCFRLKYAVDKSAVVLRYGVFYVRTKYMLLSSVQYVSVSQTPLQAVLGIANVTVHAAGGTIVVPYLRERQAAMLRKALSPKLRNIASTL